MACRAVHNRVISILSGFQHPSSGVISTLSYLYYPPFGVINRVVSRIPPVELLTPLKIFFPSGELWSSEGNLKYYY